MDRDAFDGLARLLATSPSRRKALGALLGGGFAGAIGVVHAKKGRNGSTAKVFAEATCATPGSSANLSGCNFNGQDFSGDDLSGSRLVGTVFRNATLVGTNLSSSNAKTADFRGANLCGANLRSSTLGGSDFRGANLTNATLKSSGGCTTVLFNDATVFCNTTLCDGAVRNDDCPNGAIACCGDDGCPNNQVCAGGRCGCPPGWTPESGGWCAFHCTNQPDNCGGGGCVCTTHPISLVRTCTRFPAVSVCTGSGGCPDGTACVGALCLHFCGPATA